jgi:cyanophycinase
MKNLILIIGVTLMLFSSITYATDGTLVIIGGGLRYNNQEIFGEIIELSGGEGAKIAIFPTASSKPEKYGGYAMESFTRYGAEPLFVPVAVKNIDIDYQDAVYDKELIQKVKNCTGIYFTGGSQERITQALYTEDGENTPMLDAIWDVYQNGGVIAGTSAGAAVMSTTMIRDAVDVLNVLKFGVEHGKEIDRGLGFIGEDIFIDQHFFTRGRFARALYVMAEKEYQMGIGVDENTALILRGNDVEVIGYKGAMIMDLSMAKQYPKLSEFNLKDVKLTYLDRGDKFNLDTKKVTIHPYKLEGIKVDPNAQDFAPYYDADKFYPDILANTAIVDLMFNFIDNDQTEAIGLAFTTMDDSAKRHLGFEFKFRKGPDSIGYYTGAFGAEDYTVMNIYLDITPIKMAEPLYYKIDK